MSPPLELPPPLGLLFLWNFLLPLGLLFLWNFLLPLFHMLEMGVVAALGALSRQWLAKTGMRE